MPGPKHEVARGVAVCGVPHGSDPDRLDELLGRCERLRGGPGARLVPDDLELFDRPPMSGTTMGNRRPGNEADLFLGTVISPASATAPSSR